MDSDCSSKQRESYLSLFTPETPHFFKIILEGAIRDGKLEIPRKFLSKYGNGLSNPVLLRVPSGATWHVELRKSDSEVWLQNGWQRFVEYYSLKHGHLLVFKYEGNSNFQVIIFDMSASEIEYPYLGHTEDHKSHEVCQELNMEEAKAFNSVEIMHGTPPPKKTRERSQSVCSHPRKKRRTTPTGKNKRDCGDVSSGEGDLQTKVVSSGEGDLQTKVSGELNAFGTNEYDKALQRASAFTSKNPFFLVTMQPSYINPGRKMCIPRNFTMEFLKEQLGDITLTLDGKTWSANYWRYISVNKYTKAILYNGWREFMLDNKLQVGDVCVFELIKQTEILLNVVIYRVSEDSNCYSSIDGSTGRLSTQRTGPLTSHEKARAILRASDFKSENPFFKVVMQPAYLKTRCSVNIPYKFVKKYLDEKKDRVILQVDGRTWIVKFSVDVMSSGQHKAKFHQTWKGFARDNNLEVGDVCIFELINRKETSFKVSIFPAAPDVDFSLSPQADDTRASQVASKKCLTPKLEADDDFGDCNVGISSRAAQSTNRGYQASEADDARANQAASKKCLIPKLEADDDFGHCNVGISSCDAQSTSLGCQATEADDTRASKAASKKFLIPKLEADDDFGKCNVGISSCAAQSTGLGYQATEGALPANLKPNDTKLMGIKLENPEENYTLHPSMQGYGVTSTKPRSPQTEDIWRRPPLPADARNEALQRAKAFESQNPFFIVAMQRSYIRSGHRLAIPLDFSRNHMTERVRDIILRTPTGKTWRTKCNREANETNPRAKLIDGWRTFAEDNNLEVGDVCVFEMIESNGHELSFSVVIYRAEEDERRLC